ncbi:hypothetical protein XENTR_v10008974 [Xenopus tropicalis]|nr:hypothetical protein XENTR_v10008974 [Xenopus tropicalis]
MFYLLTTVHTINTYIYTCTCVFFGKKTMKTRPTLLSYFVVYYPYRRVLPSRTIKYTKICLTLYLKNHLYLNSTTEQLTFLAQTASNILNPVNSHLKMCTQF